MSATVLIFWKSSIQLKSITSTMVLVIPQSTTWNMGATMGKTAIEFDLARIRKVSSATLFHIIVGKHILNPNGNNS